MDLTVLLFLIQDGVINGAIYSIVAIALVLVFLVTRIIFIPQGVFIAFAAFTMTALENGDVPPTGWLLLFLGCLSAISTVVRARRELTRQQIIKRLVLDLCVPAVLLGLVILVSPMRPPLPVSMALTVALIVPMGPLIYRIAFEPMKQASVLVLLIAALGVQFSLNGLGLVFFGPEGIRTTTLIKSDIALGDLVITGQSLAVVAATAASLVMLALFFEKTVAGKALRACASNRLGAQLVGIPIASAGQFAFALAAGLGAIAGILIGPMITIYYDSGFLIGLKAFVAAIIGGLGSYPLAVAAAIGVGLSEALFSFLWSNFKEVLVFTLLIPFLIWRSYRAPHAGQEE